MHQETARSLLDALDICREINARCRTVSLDEFSSQRLLYLSTERLFEIAGEAINRAARHDLKLVQGINDSGTLVGLRNRIAHDYDNILLSILWDTAVNDLPVLIAEIVALLEAHGYETGGYE